MPNNSLCDVVVDLQYGDCGKGKVVKYLAETNKYQYCFKMIGGANAGHTIYHNGIKHVGHQVPSVMILNTLPEYEDTPIKCVIGPNCFIDLEKLNNELTNLETITKKSLRQHMYLAHNAHITLPKHIEDDKSNDMSGSTHCGIRPTARDKYNRCGARVIDIADIGGQIHGCTVVNTFDLLNNNNTTRQDNVLFEGSQGFWLDINWGKYPYITSSDCTVASVISSGMPFSRITNIYGVAKIYETYVGSNKFQTDDPWLLELQKEGEEFGATTGRQRQCNWLNLDHLRQAVIQNDVSVLVFNKCDILEKVGQYKLYHNQNLIEFEDFNNMKNYIIEWVNDITIDINVKFSYSKDTL